MTRMLARDYARNGKCLFKDSDKKDPHLQALKRRGTVESSAQKKRGHNETKQTSIDRFFKGRDTGKTEKDSDYSIFDISEDSDEGDVNLIGNPVKKRKMEISHKDTKRKSGKIKGSIVESSDSDSVEPLELKPLESFVSVPSLIADSKQKKLLLESAHVKSISDLTVDSWKAPPLFQPKMTNNDISKLKMELEKKYHLPPPMYSSDLLERCKPLLKIVKLILKGSVSSSYYIDARSLSKQSRKPFFSLHHVPMSELNKFMAGFYGWKRQTLLGEFISTKYKNELSRNKSPVLKWWGVKDFATYVLAPEVLAIMSILQMKIGQERIRSKIEHSLKDLGPKDIKELQEYVLDVRDIFDATMVYGSSVMDSEPLESWEAELSKDLPSPP